MLFSVGLVEEALVFGPPAQVRAHTQKEIQRRLALPGADPAIQCSFQGEARQVIGVKRSSSAASLSSANSMNMSDADTDCVASSQASQRSSSASRSYSQIGQRRINMPLQDTTMTLAENNGRNYDLNAQGSQRARVTWQSCQLSLQNCHKDFLINRIYVLDEKLAKVKAELSREKRATKTAKTSLNNLQLKIRDVQDAKRDEQSLTIEKKSENSIRFSVRGFLAMGIRKALAVTSAIGFPMAALVDVSRQTVVRSELSVWSVLVARTGAFHDVMKFRLRSLARMFDAMQAPNAGSDDQQEDCQRANPASLVEAEQSSYHCSDLALMHDLGLPEEVDEHDHASQQPHQPSSWLCMGRGGNNTDTNGDLTSVFCLGGTAFSGDATNSGIWRRNKLQGLLLSSACMIDSRHLFSETDYFKAFAFHTTVLLGLHSSSCWDSTSNILHCTCVSHPVTPI